MKIIDRIDQLLSEAGIEEREKKKKLASVCGISYESVRKWYSGQTSAIDTEHLASISKYFRVPLDWIATGKGASEQLKNQLVPILASSEISMFLDEAFTPARFAGVQSALLREAIAASEKTFALEWQGEGMRPRIERGDTVYIDPAQNDCASDGVYLFSLGGKKPSYELGTVQETPRGLMLHFDNPAPGWEALPVEPEQCVGKVVAFIPKWLS